MFRARKYSYVLEWSQEPAQSFKNPEDFPSFYTEAMATNESRPWRSQGKSSQADSAVTKLPQIGSINFDGY